MNIFSTVGFTPATKEKDHESKEKARIVESHAVEIRDKKRLDILKKKRTDNNRDCFTPGAGATPDSLELDAKQVPLYQSQAIHSLDAETREVVDKIYKEVFKFEHICDLVIQLYSSDLLQQHRGCIGLRKLLSNEENPPIQNAIDSNCVPRFIEFIKMPYPVLQLEAAWCLTNIASGTTHQTQSIIVNNYNILCETFITFLIYQQQDKGAIPLFCKLLTSKYSDISEQAIWALGNISGDCSGYRDLILKCGGMGPLVNIIMNTSDKKIIKHGSWTMSNLCRGRPLPDYDLVKDASEPLCKVLMSETDQEVLTDASWAISYLSDGDEERIQRIINTGVVPCLVRNLSNNFLSILIPCLRTLGNICTGDHEQTDFVLGCGALPEIFKLLSNQKKAVRREACWVLSNIAAGTGQQISLIIQQPGYIEELFKRILGASEEVSREATWVISNCTSNANPIDILKLVEMRVIEVYSQVLKNSKDDKTIAIVLESFKHILQCGEKNYMQGKINPFAMQLESYGVIDILEDLQSNPNNDVYKRSIFIIETYFEVEDPTIIAE